MGIEDIIEHCHKNGVKFTFDSDCQVKLPDGKKCPNVATWEQKIKIGKQWRWIDLCDEHIKPFEEGQDIELQIILKESQY